MHERFELIGLPSGRQSTHQRQRDPLTSEVSKISAQQLNLVYKEHSIFTSSRIQAASAADAVCGLRECSAGKSNDMRDVFRS